MAEWPDSVPLAAELLSAAGAVRRTTRRAARNASPTEPLSPARSELLRLAARQPGITVAEAARELRLAPDTGRVGAGRALGRGPGGHRGRHPGPGPAGRTAGQRVTRPVVTPPGLAAVDCDQITYTFGSHTAVDQPDLRIEPGATFGCSDPTGRGSGRLRIHPDSFRGKCVFAPFGPVTGEADGSLGAMGL
jgi:hypothetical protein